MPFENKPRPELVAPAGDLTKLKIAILYGADAVYVSGQRYGLRARADNFSNKALEEAVCFAHAHRAKVYVTLNAFMHDQDLSGLSEYCGFLEHIGVDAVIASDCGVISLIREATALKVHLSTQASCLNRYAARLWRSLGVQRIVLGREVSAEEAALIRAEAGVEVEIFGHGAMCMAYSGHCTISNYTAGRDANRGGCIQSCRFMYEQAQIGGTGSIRQPVESCFMSSKDLCGAPVIGDVFGCGIDALKLEGRMRSMLYIATTCRVYRRLLDACRGEALGGGLIQEMLDELRGVPHRDYTTASLNVPAGRESVNATGVNSAANSTRFLLGLVLSTDADYSLLRLFAPLKKGMQIEILSFGGGILRWEVDALESLSGRELETARQDQVVRLPRDGALASIEAYNVLRAVKK